MVVILAFFAKNITQVFLLNHLYGNLPIVSAIIVGSILSFIVFVIYFSLLWILFLREKNIDGSFFQKIKFKKVYSILLVVFALLYLASSMYSIDAYKKSLSIDGSSHFLAGSVYENSQYNFKLTYPEGSTFAHATAQSGTGFVTRFFLPNRQTIGGDQENIGIHVDENSDDLDAVIKRRQDTFSKNGTIDIKEVQFGGQKGYRMIFVSDYTAQKGTKELSYLTVKNGTLFELNYFPVVDQNLSVVDNVASSFEFIQ